MNKEKLHIFFKQFENNFPKLVRDKIPSLIIQNEGKAAITNSEKNTDRLIELVQKKIVEESMELFSYKVKEEQIYGIADIIEVIEKLKNETGITTKEINQYRKTKNKKYGDFSKSIILISK